MPIVNGQAGRELLSDGFTAEVLRDQPSVEAKIPAWRRMLEAPTVGGSLFNDPDYVLASLEQGNGEPFVIVISRDGAVKCVAPFRRRPAKFHLRFSVFRLVSLRCHNLDDLEARPIYAQDADEMACLRAVFSKIAVCYDAFDLLHLSSFGDEESIWRLLSSEARSLGLRVVFPTAATEPHCEILLAADFDSYLQGLGSKTRSTLRRKVRQLGAESGGDAELIAVRRPEQVEAFLAEVDAVSRDSWQANTYGFHPRHTSDTIAWMECLAAHGWLRSYVLRRRGVPIAFQLGFQYKGVFHAKDFAFSREHAKHAPGNVLMYLFMEDLFRHEKPEVVDLGVGDSGQKRAFGGVATPVRSAYVARAARWELLVRLQAMLDSAERQGRGWVSRAGLDKTMRRLLKRKG